MPSPPTEASAISNSEAPGCATVKWTAPADATTETSYQIVALPTMTVHTTPSSELEVCGLEAGAKYSFEIRAVLDGAKSDPDTTSEVTIAAAQPARWFSWSSWGLILALVLAGGITALTGAAERDRAGVGFACGVLALALLILSWIGGRYGFWRPLIGADGRISTSRFTTGLWTLVVGFALAFLTARTWFYGEAGLFEGLLPGTQGGTKQTTQIWEDYLVLLGGPFAALVIARGLISTKTQNGTVQKTIEDDGTAQLKQALTDDSGNVDLVDSQYLLFNIVALGYVIVGFASEGQLPAVPSILLALTGTSAATYVVNKAVASEQPKITGVFPSRFRPGQRITITGVNLLPAGPEKPPVVSIGGLQALVDANPTDAQIIVVVPPGVAPGMQKLLVTTAARAESEPQTVEVLKDEPQILGIEPPTPKVGGEMTIRGLGFSSELDPTTTCSVNIGAAAEPVAPTKLASGMEELKVPVPEETDTQAPVEVVVTTPRKTSTPPTSVTFVR